MTQLFLLVGLLQEEGAPKASPFSGILPPMLLVVAIFYFVLIRPERKKQKARDAMLKEMKKGDEVMTSSGLYGRIAQIQDDVVTLLVADGIRLRFSRAAVQTVLGKEPAEKPAKDEDQKPAGA